MTPTPDTPTSTPEEIADPLLAAIVAHQRIMFPTPLHRSEAWTPTLADFGSMTVDAMRAALRAAGLLVASPTEEQIERAAREKYPFQHVGYPSPRPDGCRCDECYVTEMQQLAYAEGLTDAAGVTPQGAD